MQIYMNFQTMISFHFTCIGLGSHENIRPPHSMGIATNFKRGYNPALSFGAWRSPASALAWGARGRRFKSSRPDKYRPIRPQTPPPSKMWWCFLFNYFDLSTDF